MLSVILRHFGKPIYIYASVVAFSFLFMFYSLKLWKADLNIPFAYTGDAILSSEIIKGIIDNGWYLNNYYTGAPFGQEFYDFPLSDGLFMAIYKIISLFTSDYAIAFNLFYLLGFLLTPITSFVALRNFKISYWPALMVSILFTYLPFHFLRIHHTHLAAYFIIPLIIMVVIWILNDKIPPLFTCDERIKSKFHFIKIKNLFFIFICILTGASGVYYAFFSCILLAIAAITSMFLDNRFKRMAGSIIAIIIISITVGVNILPNMIYTYNNGPNIETAIRGSAESDIYGLKISQLIIPATDHGIAIVAKVKAIYAQYPLPSEGSAYIGLVGIIGFLFLILSIIKDKTKIQSEKRSIMGFLAILNLGILLIATIGGFGSLFALFVSSQIRAYNRISVFIAFLSLFALALLLERLLGRYNRKKVYRVAINICIVILIIVGYLEQTDKNFVPNYVGIKSEYRMDEKYISEIETLIPENSMILQLPYVSFPENPPVYKMIDYDHFKSYLHSNSLRWSYGAMKGRATSDWLKDASASDTTKLLEKLSFAGFQGVYIDRYGYEDGGEQIEKEISEILERQPLESEDKRKSFYNLEQYNKNKRSQYTDKQWGILQYNALHPVIVEWKNTIVEGTKESNWRWFPNQAVLTLNNTSDKEQIISLDMSLSSGESVLSSFSIKSDFFEDNLMISSEEKKYLNKLTVPPGKHDILFHSSANRIHAPEDPRYLVFKVVDFKWENIVD